MKDFLTHLREKTAEFGNHYNKHIQAVSKHLDHLIQRLEQKKRRDAVHVLHPAYDFESDLPTLNRDPYNHDAYHYELYGINISKDYPFF